MLACNKKIVLFTFTLERVTEHSRINEFFEEKRNYFFCTKRCYITSITHTYVYMLRKCMYVYVQSVLTLYYPFYHYISLMLHNIILWHDKKETSVPRVIPFYAIYTCPDFLVW